ncbi:MAG: hypothetical protein C0613_12850 [Desulfobulbaceae bacterium]|nr:MAG: hypothetical protein C0613_12850 [Desulfobulbaceae bacterium]
MTHENGTSTLINSLKQSLETWHRQTQTISSDPNALNWKRVNIESFTSVIENLGLSSIKLRRARDSFAELIQEILHQITLLSNALHNLESDIKHGQMAPEIAKAAAHKIEEQCQELKQEMDKLLDHHKILVEGCKTLKENLNFYTFLPQARQLSSGKQKSVFETGYTIYLTVADDPDVEHNENVRNIFTYLGKVKKLQENIEQTKLPPLPAMVSSFVKQQLNICRSSCEQVHFFIHFVSDYFQSEKAHIKAFHDNLNQLKSHSLTELLLEIPSQTEVAGRCIQRFTHKKFLMDEIQKAYRLLLFVEYFLDLLTTDFIPYLQKQVSRKNGLLNPQTLAMARSRSYFNGIRGLWRFVRMLLFSFSAQSLISQNILEEKIAEAINTCPTFFSTESPDNNQTTSFINSFFDEYKSPFPRDELVDITKKSMLTYASILFKVFHKFKAEPEEGVEEEHRVMTLGRLSDKIEIRAENLRKYREKFENKDAS